MAAAAASSPQLDQLDEANKLLRLFYFNRKYLQFSFRVLFQCENLCSMGGHFKEIEREVSRINKSYQVLNQQIKTIEPKIKESRASAEDIRLLEKVLQELEPVEVEICRLRSRVQHYFILLGDLAASSDCLQDEKLRKWLIFWNKVNEELKAVSWSLSLILTRIKRGKALDKCDVQKFTAELLEKQTKIETIFTEMSLQAEVSAISESLHSRIFKILFGDLYERVLHITQEILWLENWRDELENLSSINVKLKKFGLPSGIGSSKKSVAEMEQEVHQRVIENIAKTSEIIYRKILKLIHVDGSYVLTDLSDSELKRFVLELEFREETLRCVAEDLTRSCSRSDAVEEADLDDFYLRSLRGFWENIREKFFFGSRPVPIVERWGVRVNWQVVGDFLNSGDAIYNPLKSEIRSCLLKELLGDRYSEVYRQMGYVLWLRYWYAKLKKPRDNWAANTIAWFEMLQHGKYLGLRFSREAKVWFFLPTADERLKEARERFLQNMSEMSEPLTYDEYNLSLRNIVKKKGQELQRFQKEVESKSDGVNSWLWHEFFSVVNIADLDVLKFVEEEFWKQVAVLIDKLRSKLLRDEFDLIDAGSKLERYDELGVAPRLQFVPLEILRRCSEYQLSAVVIGGLEKATEEGLFSGYSALDERLTKENKILFSSLGGSVVLAEEAFLLNPLVVTSSILRGFSRFCLESYFLSVIESVDSAELLIDRFDAVKHLGKLEFVLSLGFYVVAFAAFGVGKPALLATNYVAAASFMDLLSKGFDLAVKRFRDDHEGRITPGEMVGKFLFLQLAFSQSYWVVGNLIAKMFVDAPTDAELIANSGWCKKDSEYFERCGRLAREILDVKTDVTADELSRIRKKWMRLRHPDKCGLDEVCREEAGRDFAGKEWAFTTIQKGL